MSPKEESDYILRQIRQAAAVLARITHLRAAGMANEAAAEK